MLALTYPQNKRWCWPQEWGPLGDPWMCGGHGTLESVGEGTRWHLLAGTTQGLLKPSTVKMSSVCRCTLAGTHRHTHSPRTLFLLWTPLPSSFPISAFSQRCCCCCCCWGARSPECPLITQAQAWHCHVSPWHDQNQVSLAWGWKPSDFSHQKMLSKESVDYSYSALKMHFKNSEMLRTVWSTQREQGKRIMC